MATILPTIVEQPVALAYDARETHETADKVSDTILDDECYDCLDCDYENFDQWTEHHTPALSHSPAATPTEQPSTPLLAPTQTEHVSLGERLLSACTHGLHALGTSALQALLPSDEPYLRLSPRLSPGLSPRLSPLDEAISHSPVILLEPARPGAQVRFIVSPPASKSLSIPSMTLSGMSGFFGVGDGVEDSDEGLEMFEDLEQRA
ncbi:hypothetical protein CspeluHIS016_0211070 [Cutaneotrichosporon spelunceum]|uniref:Uncharacterized protein n=1 Tax=Cutaneotrichosporon spelunceum TaxID=1672016 RepID=A0AAD3TSC8_9TREE|nr:hypothetical protein CspeluHIS016_0211070 [Cutaneotrichosporon spelunceum]